MKGGVPGPPYDERKLAENWNVGACPPSLLEFGALAQANSQTVHLTTTVTILLQTTIVSKNVL